MTDLERADAYLRMVGFEEMLKLMKPRKREKLLLNIATRLASNIVPIGMEKAAADTRERAQRLFVERIPKLRVG